MAELPAEVLLTPIRLAAQAAMLFEAARAAVLVAARGARPMGRVVQEAYLATAPNLPMRPTARQASDTPAAAAVEETLALQAARMVAMAAFQVVVVVVVVQPSMGSRLAMAGPALAARFG
ncbi:MULTISPECIES: hypothetical protein [unclassified Mesorhizobium]|uniref:hypothetical protein n=1 Tax=unclassified Mesorhizobium TaxID=325217 RepID=UPI0016734452|nr:MULTISPECIES: hypothetical protein [unclassified Mesorhizobium]